MTNRLSMIGLVLFYFVVVGNTWGKAWRYERGHHKTHRKKDKQGNDIEKREEENPWLITHTQKTKDSPTQTPWKIAHAFMFSARMCNSCSVMWLLLKIRLSERAWKRKGQVCRFYTCYVQTHTSMSHFI